MPDILQRATAWLHSQRHTHMTKTVTYRRGGESIELAATVGRTDFDVVDASGIGVRVESRDYLIRAADLDFGDGPTLPTRGDRIEEASGETTHVYEVLTLGNQSPWRHSDPSRETLRIHTKQIAVE